MSVRRKPQATLVEGFFEIFSSLIALKQAETLSQTFNLTIPAHTSLSSVINVAPNQVILVSEALMTLAADNAFSISIVVDNETKYSDLSMQQLRYNNNPLQFLRLGAFYPAKNAITLQLTNLTASPQFFGIWLTGGIVEKGLWNSLIELYFRSLLTELGIQT